MSTKFEAAETYTDDELIALYREYIARGAVAGEEIQTRDGRRIRFPGIDQAFKVIEKLESRSEVAETNGHTTNLVRMRGSR